MRISPLANKLKISKGIMTARRWAQAYVEAGKTAAVAVEGVVVELNELLCMRGDSWSELSETLLSRPNAVSV